MNTANDTNTHPEGMHVQRGSPLVSPLQSSIHALERLCAWMCEHTGPRDGTLEMLCSAHSAIDHGKVQLHLAGISEARFLQALQECKDYDDALNRREQVPTASDYNALMSIVLSAFPAFPDFPNLAWTLADDGRAAAEGWNIYEADGRLQIQAIDDAGQFDFDEDAIELVRASAAKGSEFHSRAIHIHAVFEERDQQNG